MNEMQLRRQHRHTDLNGGWGGEIVKEQHRQAPSTCWRNRHGFIKFNVNMTKKQRSKSFVIAIAQKMILKFFFGQNSPKKFLAFSCLFFCSSLFLVQFMIWKPWGPGTVVRERECGRRTAVADWTQTTNLSRGSINICKRMNPFQFVYTILRHLGLTKDTL